MQEFIVVVIASFSAISLIVNIRSLSQSLAQASDMPGVLAVTTLILGGLLYEANILPRGQLVQFALFAIIGAAVGLAALRSARSHDGSFLLRLPVFLPALISAVMFLINAFSNPELPLEQLLGRLLAVAILILAGLGASVFNLRMDSVLHVITISILSMLVISPFTGNIWRPCDIFKCGPFGAIYTGPFGSENALAIFCCVGILCVVATWSGKRSLLSVFALALTLYATESRTSQLALAGAIVSWLLSAAWRKALPGPGTLKAQRVVFSAAALMISATSFYLILNAEPSSFSNRGNIWIRGLSALGSHWWSGLGLDRWTYLQSAGVLPLLFPHNENLLLLFGGGLLSVLILCYLLINSISSGSRYSERIGFAAAYAVFLSILGITEEYWNPIALDGHTFLVLPLIFLVARKTYVRDESVPHSSLSQARGRG